MKKIFKSLMVIFVVTASLFFLAGQSLDYFVFKYRQTVIRKDIKSQIKNGVEETELFTFDAKQILAADLDWVKPGKEFRMKGSMYDIVKLDFENGKFVYKCINDTQETKLFAELDQMVKKRMNDDSDDYLKNLVKDFVKVYFESEKSFYFSRVENENTIFHFSFPHFSFEIPSPPPQKLV